LRCIRSFFSSGIDITVSFFVDLPFASCDVSCILVSLFPSYVRSSVRPSAEHPDFFNELVEHKKKNMAALKLKNKQAGVV
jgi:hypothetical protein